MTADLSTSWWRRGSGPEPVLRNSRNTCSRSVTTCWWSTEARKRRFDADKGRLSFSYCGEFKPMETGRIVVPASRRTRTATDLSPKTEEGKRKRGEFLRSSPPSILCVFSSNFSFFSIQRTDINKMRKIHLFKKAN